MKTIIKHINGKIIGTESWVDGVDYISILKEDFVIIDGDYVPNFSKDNFIDTTTLEITSQDKPKPIIPPLEAANITFEKQVDALSPNTPKSERDTWPRQEQEARAYTADNTVSTPLIDSLAANRGVDKDGLVVKIIQKADAYAPIIGALVGQRQKIEDGLGV